MSHLEIISLGIEVLKNSSELSEIKTSPPETRLDKAGAVLPIIIGELRKLENQIRFMPESRTDLYRTVANIAGGEQDTIERIKKRSPDMILKDFINYVFSENDGGIMKQFTWYLSEIGNEMTDKMWVSLLNFIQPAHRHDLLYQLTYHPNNYRLGKIFSRNHAKRLSNDSALDKCFNDESKEDFCKIFALMQHLDFIEYLAETPELRPMLNGSEYIKTLD